MTYARWAVIGEVQGVELYETRIEAEDRKKALASRHIKATVFDGLSPLPRGIGLGSREHLTTDGKPVTLHLTHLA